MPGNGVVVVSGPAGIGKTAMALHWAQSQIEYFPDGQLYLDLQGHSAAGPVRPVEVLGQFIRALGIPQHAVPVELAERATLFRSMAAERRLLIVLDDALSAAQVSPLLPGTGDSVVVVTSRWRLAGLMMRGARGVQLDPLSPDAALELLDTTLGPERTRPERDMAEELVEQCGRSPLALSIAAARLVTRPRWSLARLVRALAQERRRLTVLSAQDAGNEITIRATLMLSYQNLPEPTRRLYRFLGLHPGGTFDGPMAASLADVPVDAAEEALDLLAEVNLLDDLPDSRYRFQSLVRLHALELVEEHEPEAERREATRRLTEWMVAATLAASRAVAPYRRLTDPGFDVLDPPEFDGVADALDWLDAEFGNLRALARHALDTGLHRHAWLLVDVSWPLFLHRGHHVERLDYDRIGLAAARAAGDATAEAKMLNRTGLALRQLGRLDEAADDFTAALDLWRRLDVPARIASTRRRLGLLELDRGDLDAAASQFRAALEMFREVGEERRTALTLCDLGVVLIRSGRAAEAVAVLDDAVRFLTSGPDPYNGARALVLLGQAHALGADPAAATDAVERGLATMREIGSAIGEADALHVLGDLARTAGRADEARHLYTTARGILADTGAPTRILDERLAELDAGR
ncbi:ATP-binding protein [Actinomadura meridiana]|uniref:ATP-binding protein n=1 Tax=Actinomadura meridiana TaxID=559626 RepID=UPI0031F0EF63